MPCWQQSILSENVLSQVSSMMGVNIRLALEKSETDTEVFKKKLAVLVLLAVGDFQDRRCPETSLPPIFPYKCIHRGEVIAGSLLHHRTVTQASQRLASTHRGTHVPTSSG